MRAGRDIHRYRGPAGCGHRVFVDGRPTDCGAPPSYADDQPYGARPERRHRVYLCAEHAAQCADPRLLTVEDLRELEERKATEAYWRRVRRENRGSADWLVG